nr:hypothetical protein [Tanacetum cinerariifolium]
MHAVSRTRSRKHWRVSRNSLKRAPQVGSHTMAHTSSGPSTQVRQSLKRRSDAVCANTSSDTYTTITDFIMQKRRCIKKEGPILHHPLHLYLVIPFLGTFLKHMEIYVCVAFTTLLSSLD